MANLLDRFILEAFPGWALAREKARRVHALYEAGRRDLQRKQGRSSGSGDTEVLRAGTMPREQARYLEENHDIALGALNILVANVVGGNGITIEPQPRNKDGSIHHEFADQIRVLISDWARKPEVTFEHDWPSAQRIACRTWIRDGEFFCQLHQGFKPTLNHGTRVPFSLELIEADLVPMIHNSYESPVITAGIERNAWNRPIAYYLYKQHPGDMYRIPVLLSELKRVSADFMLHPKMTTRFNQARGMSVFAAVLSRLDDIKDYEESERIAAKVAASMAAYIRKGTPDMYDDTSQAQRNMRFRPGMIFDDLLPGEEIGTIDSNRPNPQLQAFRNGQLRAVAAGLGVNYSSLSRDYDGSYSSQRQELVEGWMHYQVIQDQFTSQFVRPSYEAFLNTALLNGNLVLPAGIDPDRLNDALYIGPQMPWVDPVKEAEAWGLLERNGHASGPEIIRRRGQNPMDVLNQESGWRQRWADQGIPLGIDPSMGTSSQSSPSTQDTNNAAE